MSQEDILQPNAQLLRIFIGSRDLHEGRNLFEVVVQEARAAGLAGATVFEGFLGYGDHSVVHQAGLWRLSQDLPIVIECVDEAAKLKAFLPRLQELLGGGGLVTLEDVTVLTSSPAAPTGTEDAP